MRKRKSPTEGGERSGFRFAVPLEGVEHCGAGNLACRDLHPACAFQVTNSAAARHLLQTATLWTTPLWIRRPPACGLYHHLLGPLSSIGYPEITAVPGYRGLPPHTRFPVYSIRLGCTDFGSSACASNSRTCPRWVALPAPRNRSRLLSRQAIHPAFARATYRRPG